MNSTHKFPPLLLLTAATLSTYLAWNSWQGVAVGGCLGSGCDQVAASRHAWLLGLPVGLWGAGVYVAAAVALCCGWRRVFAGLAGLIGGAALWFIGLQGLVIGAWCAGCLAVHALAVSAVILAARPAGISAFQHLSISAFTCALGAALPAALPGAMPAPAPAIANLDAAPLLTPGNAPAPAAGSAETTGPAADTGRRLRLLDDRFDFSFDELPRLGPADARHLLVAVTTPTCGYCRRAEESYARLIDEFPAGELAVVLLPGALDAGPGARMQESLLTLWRENPAAWNALHRGIVRDDDDGRAPDADAIHRRAVAAFGDPAEFEHRVKLHAPANRRLLRQVADLAAANAAASGRPVMLPQLVSGSSALLGSPDLATLRSIVRRQIGKNPPPPGDEPPVLAPAPTDEPLFVPGQAQWARSTLSQASSSADTRALATDADGFVYATGRFLGTVDFYGTTLSATSTSVPSGFVAKFDGNGQLQWVRKLATNNWTELHAITVAANGDIWVGGTGSGAFSDNGVSFTVPSTNGSNALLFKLNQQGLSVWGGHWGGSGTDRIDVLTMDRDQNVVVGGVCFHNFEISGIPVACNSTSKGVTYRLNQQFNVLDLKVLVGNNAVLIQFLDVDGDNNLILGIESSGASNINIGVPITTTSRTLILAKYTLNQTAPVWHKVIQGSTVLSLTKSAIFNRDDSIVIGGGYAGSVNFGGVDDMPVPIGTSGFLVRYDKDGNFLWQKQLGDGPFSIGDRVNSISASPSGMIGVTGIMRSSETTIAGCPALESSTSQSAFFAMFSIHGDCMWAKKIVGNAAGFGYHVASLPNSDFVYGGYTAAADFGFGTISTGPLNREAYLVRVTGFPSPEIGVEAGGVELASGGPPLDAGSAVIGGTAAALTLTLRNDGGEELTGIAVTPGGAQPGDFILDTSATATTLAPGGTTTFSVQFAPTAAGARAATISIASNDYDENPFVIALGGTGLLPEVALAVSPDTVAEDSGGGLVFTFTRNGGTGSPLAVDFAVGGTAGFPGDYTADGADSFSASSGTLTIPAGSASAALTLVPVADPVLEVDETATLTVLAGASYLAGSPAAATGTLINDDTEVSVTVSPATLAEDATGSFAFTLTRNGPLAAPLSVNLGVGGSAAFPADYNVTGADSFSASTASVTFAPGSTTAVLEITPQADTTVEPDESVILTVVSGSGYLAAAPVSATATLVNDDTDVSVTVSPASVPEDGAANLVFTFTRVGVTSGALSANFSVGGSATFGTDYSVSGAASFSASAGSVNFAQDAATASVTVDPVADSTSEPNESVQLTVLAGGGYNAASPVSATGFINDDDSNISVTVSPASIKEDGAQNLVFTFTRTGLTANAVTVNFTVGGTANFPGDYSVSGAASFAAGSGTVAMAAGASTATVTVDPALDLLTEPDETVTLTVAAGSGYTVGSPVSATGTIENDDTLVQVGVAPTAVAEDGEQNLVYTFTRSGVTNVPLTVGFGVGGTASSGSDYTASGTASFGTSTGTVFFPADVTTKEVTVDPTADTLIEPDETVILTLTSGSNYRTAGPPATGTILTDDTEVTVFLNPATIVESGPGSLSFSFARNGPLADPLTVNFTVGGTATFGSDYTVANAASFSATSGSVTFPAGMAFRAVNVFPIADTVVEPDETVILTIVAGTGYQPGLTFSYTGTILNDDIEQEIAVEQPSGSGLTSGAATSDFGALVNGSSKTRVFTIRNLGTVPLTGISVDKSGPQAARFAITQPAASIPGGGSSTFAVTFTPTESGPCSASLAIASNDANENPFTIALQGSGGSAQQLLDAALAAAGLSGPNAHPGATPFHDGVPNLLKYAFHMNLTGPDRRTLVPTTGTVGLPVMRIVSGSVRYEFLRRKNSGLIYTPQQSSNLSGSGWQAASGTTTVTSIDENWERVEIQQPVGVARFFRVVVGL